MKRTAADRPLGPEITDWTPPPRPGPDVIEGRYLQLQRLSPERDAPDIFAATLATPSVWDYLGNGPFDTAGSLQTWMEKATGSADVFYTFMDRQTGDPIGYASFMRIDAANGVLEIGNVMITPAAQQSRAASEGLMAMIGWVFAAGYRRVEWKCNALNEPSRRAANRYGFTFEGIFRNHMIIKGRNRDTAWFAMTVTDWPAVKSAYDKWLDPDNFDDAGVQRKSLSELTLAAVLHAETTLSTATPQAS